MLHEVAGAALGLWRRGRGRGRVKEALEESVVGADVDGDVAKETALRRAAVENDKANRAQSEWGMRLPPRGKGELWTPYAPR